MNRHPGVTAVVVRRMVRAVTPMVAMYWAIMLVVYVLVAGSIVLFDDLEQSMWSNIGGPPPRYWLLSMGVVTVLGGRVYVALGVTRRQIAEAYLVLYALWAAFFAIVYTAGFGPEHLFYSAADALGGLSEPYPVAGPGDVARTFLSSLLINLVYLTSGALIGIGFYRYRVLGGLLIIPIALIPPVAAETVFGARWAGLGVNTLFDLPAAPLPAGLAIGAVIAAVSLAGTYLTYRTLPLRPASTR